MRLDYDVYAGGIFLVSGVLDLNLQADHYSAGIEAKGGQIIDLLSRWSYVASAEGRIADGARVQPDHFRSERNLRRKHRSLDLDYDRAGQVQVNAQPPQSELAAAAVPPEHRPNTLDPLSAAVGIIAVAGQAGCAGTFPVFDGRRRYDLILTSNGTDTLEKTSRALYSGPAEKCTVRLHPVAGFERDRDEGDFFEYGQDRQATVWFAPPDPVEQRVPFRIQVEHGWTVFVMNLVAAKPA